MVAIRITVYPGVNSEKIWEGQYGTKIQADKTWNVSIRRCDIRTLGEFSKTLRKVVSESYGLTMFSKQVWLAISCSAPSFKAVAALFSLVLHISNKSAARPIYVKAHKRFAFMMLAQLGMTGAYL